MLRRFLILTLLISTSAKAQFILFPAIFAVKPQPANQALDVRAAPDGASEDIGDLAGGTKIEVLSLDQSGEWARIVWDGGFDGDGWVARRQLVATPRLGDDFSGMPINLICAGIEPFWNAQINDGDFGFAMEGTEMRHVGITNSVVSSNNLRANYGFYTADYTGFLRRAECSDGASDIPWGWSLDLLRNRPKTRLLSGCCSTDLSTPQKGAIAHTGE